uniref:Uncharacterized protein n=1 Tax=Anguilla anguilla TaxID=7936 RepID=A0A0E9SXS9_ANGAN
MLITCSLCSVTYGRTGCNGILVQASANSKAK